MISKTHIDIINCFCTHEEDSGNPAAIVTQFKKDNAAKQKLAKDLETPVTVFLSSKNEESHELEFFYPEAEMPLCLHGTLGVGYFLLKDTLLSHLTCTTKNGTKLVVRRRDSIIQVLVSTQPFQPVTIDKDEVCQMLRINSDEITLDFPFEISSVGSPKLLVPLQSYEKLKSLTPDFDLIKKWSLENQVNGLYVYAKDTVHDSFDFYARAYNPKTGHQEDAATGVAAAALALSLKQSLVIGQGEFIKRPSEIIVSYENPENIWVGGRAQ